MRMEKNSLKRSVAYCYRAPRASCLRVIFGLDAIAPIPPNGFALAANLHFVLSDYVAFREQNSLVLARTTETLAQWGEELAFAEPGNPANGDLRSMNS
jgi:hypothetical protein